MDKIAIKQSYFEFLEQDFGLCRKTLTALHERQQLTYTRMLRYVILREYPAAMAVSKNKTQAISLICGRYDLDTSTVFRIIKKHWGDRVVLIGVCGD